MTIAIIATIKIKEGQAEAFEAEFSALAAAVRANEPGNLLYQLTRSRSNALSYKVMELYADKAAMKAHSEAEHFRAAGARMAACFDGQPDIELLDAL